MFKQFSRILLAVVVVLAILVFCDASFAQGNRDQALEHVREVHARNTNRLMAIKGVQGCAVGMDLTDKPVITVFTAGHGAIGIPAKLDDVPVQVVVTGKFYAMKKPDNPGKPPRPDKESVDPKSYFARPVPIGVSTGHPDITAGTIGARVTDGTNVHAISNNHVSPLLLLN